MKLSKDHCILLSLMALFGLVAFILIGFIVGKHMKKLALIATGSMLILSGCTQTWHRYGPHPFGERSTYDVIYSDASAGSLYNCIYHRVAARGYKMDSGWPPQNDFESYFVSDAHKQVARFDFDTREARSVGVQVAVETAGNQSDRQFVDDLKLCDKS